MSKYLDVSQCTPGEWKPVEDAQGICGLIDAQKPGYAIAWFSSAHQPMHGYVGDIEFVVGKPQRQADARLIAEAGTVAHETGKGPRQLADEREALLEAYRDARDTILNDRDGLAESGMDSDQTNAVLGVIDDAFAAAITLAEGGGQ